MTLPAPDVTTVACYRFEDVLGHAADMSLPPPSAMRMRGVAKGYACMWPRALIVREKVWDVGGWFRQPTKITLTR